MIKFSRPVLFSMALLAGTAAFTGCNSSDDLVIEDNPVAPIELTGETVKTQFSINIPAAGSKKRLTETVTQGQTTPVFRGMKDIFMIPFGLADNATITATSTLVPNGKINLNSLGTATNIDNSYYSEITIPINTTNMLFYAAAATDNGVTDKANGSLTPSYNSETKKDPSSWNNTDKIGDILSFNLKEINVKPTEAVEKNIAEALTNIANTESWKAIENTEDPLKTLRDNFIGLKSGSGDNVLKTVQELYNIVKDGADGSVYAAIKSSIKSQSTVFSITENTTISYALDGAASYPTTLGLPAGVSLIEWDTNNNKFSYKHDSSVTVGDMSFADFQDYVYPSELYYFVNSSIKASSTNTTQIASGETWSTYVEKATLFDQSKVAANSQLVVLKDQVQYSVARFVVNPQFTSTSVIDNGNHNIITIGGNSFEIKGLLVGGQHLTVDWEFNPQGDANKTIYDCSFGATKYMTTDPTTAAIQTLVLETIGNTNNSDESVNFALELVNKTGAPFYGQDGIVYEDGTFYLIGKLTSNAEHTKVFKKDYVTTANVKVNSLQNAYKVVPDLRATKLSFGLSVNLTWEKGLTQDVEIK